MWEKIRVVFTIPELRKKILLTLGLLALYRVGWHIPLPVINKEVISRQSSDGLGDFINKVAIFAASDLRNATIFGLGIMPYISASIIFQLLGTVYKPIEELRKEGETGRKKINEYTRYLTVLLCFVQSWAYVALYLNRGSGSESLISPAFASPGEGLGFGWQLTTVLTMTCGTVFLMWLGEQIDEFGIGNGISLLIMAGIVCQIPRAIRDLHSQTEYKLNAFSGNVGIETLVILVGLFIGIVFGVVFITLAQRRIPIQSAKHVRGRRVFGGNRQYLPLRINQSGVMPIVFASSLLMVPAMMFTMMANVWASPHLANISQMFYKGSSLLYNLLYIALIYFFCYFWTAITFNPKEMSDNLKDYGTFIPGYRPGKRTADYLEKVMIRITYVGAAFLAVVAVAPTVVTSAFSVQTTLAGFYGGTGLLIGVSVAFDLVQKIDSHLVMRNYRGLLES